MLMLKVQLFFYCSFISIINGVVNVKATSKTSPITTTTATLPSLSCLNDPLNTWNRTRIVFTLYNGEEIVYRQQTQIQLINNDITNINNDSFMNLTNLQTLYLMFNQLTCLLDTRLFQSLLSLKLLHLGGNQLQLLHSNIFTNLSNLQYLMLQSNQLTLLNTTLFRNLFNLEQLILDYNNLVSLSPLLFSNLQNLKGLSLIGNKLTSLDSYLLFKGLTNLRRLDLSSNQLISLSPCLFKSLTQLEQLFLFSNNLTQLNDANMFFNLTALTLLNLSSNKLRSIHSRVFLNIKNSNQLTINLKCNALLSSCMNERLLCGGNYYGTGLCTVCYVNGVCNGLNCDCQLC